MRPLVLWFFCLVFAGCGSEEVTPKPDSTSNPGGHPSCEILASRVLQDPLTGGNFHCLWCNRQWKWTIPWDSPGLFVLIDLACERLRSEAYLEVRDAHASVLWQREIEQGEDEIHCIQQDQPYGGALSVRLRGTRELLLAGDLIEEFRGSIYLKVFDDQGYLVAGPNF